MMAWSAACGFPSPAEDYLDRPLDFNELLVENPAATFAVRIAGDSMTGAGLFPATSPSSIAPATPTNDCIVLALLDGEFTVKRYRPSAARSCLQAGKSRPFPIAITEDRAFEIWGVITRRSACCNHARPDRPRRLQQFLRIVRARVSAGAARRAGRRAVEQRRLRDRAQQRSQGARHRHGRAVAPACASASTPPA